jgi:hypothetical protein
MQGSKLTAALSMVMCSVHATLAGAATATRSTSNMRFDHCCHAYRKHLALATSHSPAAAADDDDDDDVAAGV